MSPSPNATSDDFPRLKAWTRDDHSHMFHPSRISSVAEIAKPLEVAIDDVMRTRPHGWEGKAKDFYANRNSTAQMLDLRAELVIAAALGRNGVTYKFLSSTPDLVCLTSMGEFGLEVTCKQRRSDLAELSHRVRERLKDEHAVIVTLRKRNEDVAIDRETLDSIVDDIVGAVKAGTSGWNSFGDGGLRAIIDFEHAIPGTVSVPWQSTQEFNPDWSLVPRAVRSAVAEKATKRFEVPSVAVVDLTRYDPVGMWPKEVLPTDFARLLTPEVAGPLHGVALVRCGYMQSLSIEVLQTWVNPVHERGPDILELLSFATRVNLPLKLQSQLKDMYPKFPGAEG